MADVKKPKEIKGFKETIKEFYNKGQNPKPFMLLLGGKLKSAMIKSIFKDMVTLELQAKTDHYKVGEKQYKIITIHINNFRTIIKIKIKH